MWDDMIQLDDLNPTTQNLVAEKSTVYLPPCVKWCVEDKATSGNSSAATPDTSTRYQQNESGGLNQTEQQKT